MSIEDPQLYQIATGEEVKKLQQEKKQQVVEKEALDDVIQLQQKKETPEVYEETAATRGRDRGGLQGGGGVVQQ